ncbi:GNAT family N-acetyltransferase [Streptomyces xantholiticus]|uniref:GNAT family N-acetyltransferase n=1 Tax=Streptomyces xantholiticus TaxID=68285 RepID=A0ABV1UZW0_9ACTN
MGKASRRRAEHRARMAAPKTVSPVVRPLSHADLPQAMHLLHGVVEQNDPKALDLYLSEPSPANRFGLGLVAEVDEEVVGVVAGAGIRVLLPGLRVSGDEITRRIGLLDVVAVHPDHRRKGIGTLLCDSLLDGFRRAGHRLVVTKLAAGRHDLVPIYSAWGWRVGEPGAGVAVEIGPHQVVIAEDLSARTAWTALTTKVRPIPSGLPGVSVVTGMFD